MSSPTVPGDASPGGSATQPNHVVIFVHVPKTGGSSFLNYVTQVFPPAVRLHRDMTPEGWSVLPDWLEQVRAIHIHERSKLRFVYLQHLPYGVHSLFPQPASYVSFLREPWKRLVSDFRHQARSPGEFFHERIRRGATVEDYVDELIAANTVNYMTRLIGGFHFDTMLAGSLPIDQSVFDPLPENALDVARRIIDDHYPVIGLQHRFDESLAVMERLFGWRGLEPKVSNVASNKPVRDLDGSAREKFVEHAALDYALYRHVEQRLDRQIDSATL